MTCKSSVLILKKVSEKGFDILEGIGKVVLDEIEKDESQIIASDVDSVFDSVFDF